MRNVSAASHVARQDSTIPGTKVAEAIAGRLKILYESNGPLFGQMRLLSQRKCSCIGQDKYYSWYAGSNHTAERETDQ